MQSRIVRGLWVLAPCVAVVASLGLGYDGWVGIFVWTVLVAPLVVKQHRDSLPAGEPWPSYSLLALWIIALVTSGTAGLTPRLISSPPAWVAVPVFLFSWIGVITSVCLVLIATVGVLRRPRDIDGRRPDSRAT